ncbi:hypothetical protein BSKO_14089 [Bryopsis sp. KO-2023]|nr:hypothetical protein BSKO_14089 [Bryopsis sp. KO-2023]
MGCRNEDVMVDSADELSGESVRSYHGLTTLAKAQLLRQRRSLPDPVSKPQETQDATTRSGKRPIQRAPPVKRKRREASKLSVSDIEARPCGIRWVRWIFDTDPISDTSKRKDCQQQNPDTHQHENPTEGKKDASIVSDRGGSEGGRTVEQAGGELEVGGWRGGKFECVEIGMDPPHRQEEEWLFSSDGGRSYGGGGENEVPAFMCLNMIFDCDEDAFAMAVGDEKRNFSCSFSESSSSQEEEEEEEGGWGQYEYRKLGCMYKGKKEIKKAIRKKTFAPRKSGEEERTGRI